MPSDVLRPRRPDGHFAAEAAAARELGIEVGLVDHDALARGAYSDGVARVAGEHPDAVYRGWMLDTVHYAGFAAALAGRGVVLRTSAAAYRRAHELPGWYAALAPRTPESLWTQGTGRAAFDAIRRELGAGPAVLRDWTKSMKHHWDEAAYVPDLADAAGAWRVASRFAELRGDVQGGFVLRRFEEFTSAEARTWWVAGRCVLAGPHPDTPDQHPDGLGDPRLGVAVAALELPFVTVDLARRSDGVWRVVELGDGQVSDRPPAVAPEQLLGALFPPVGR